MAAERPLLRASGRVRRRKRVNRTMEGLAILASAAAVGVLGIVVVSVLLKGVSALNLDFFTKTQPLFGETGGGVAHAIVGSLVLVALATAMALPAGVLVAIYVSEFARGRVALVIRTALDVLNGVPSIVIGIFVFALLVVGHQQSAFAGSCALAIIMLPLVSRATQEVLALVPQSLREAGLALGVSKWRTTLRVVLPTALGGILTGTTLAVARAAGETAPLLFTSSIFLNKVQLDPGHALASIPITIFTYSESPDPNQHAQAWAAAFVLIMFVLVTSLTARYLLHRSRRKLTGAGTPARPSFLRAFTFLRGG
jgi:phosphate transport system permease protein